MSVEAPTMQDAAIASAVKALAAVERIDHRTKQLSALASRLRHAEQRWAANADRTDHVRAHKEGREVTSEDEAAWAEASGTHWGAVDAVLNYRPRSVEELAWKADLLNANADTQLRAEASLPEAYLADALALAAGDDDKRRTLASVDNREAWGEVEREWLAVQASVDGDALALLDARDGDVKAMGGWSASTQAAFRDAADAMISAEPPHWAAIGTKARCLLSRFDGDANTPWATAALAVAEAAESIGAGPPANGAIEFVNQCCMGAEKLCRDLAQHPTGYADRAAVDGQVPALANIADAIRTGVRDLSQINPDHAAAYRLARSEVWFSDPATDAWQEAERALQQASSDTTRSRDEGPDQEDRTTAYFDAEDRLFATPAPNLSALAVKMRVHLHRSVADRISDDLSDPRHFSAFLSSPYIDERAALRIYQDILRLAGERPEIASAQPFDPSSIINLARTLGARITISEWRPEKPHRTAHINHGSDAPPAFELAEAVRALNSLELGVLADALGRADR